MRHCSSCLRPPRTSASPTWLASCSCSVLPTTCGWRPSPAAAPGASPPTPTPVSRPRFSPEGGRVAWISTRDGHAEVMVADVDGGTRRPSHLAGVGGDDRARLDGRRPGADRHGRPRGPAPAGDGARRGPRRDGRATPPRSGVGSRDAPRRRGRTVDADEPSTGALEALPRRHRTTAVARPGRGRELGAPAPRRRRRAGVAQLDRRHPRVRQRSGRHVSRPRRWPVQPVGARRARIRRSDAGHPPRHRRGLRARPGGRRRADRVPRPRGALPPERARRHADGARRHPRRSVGDASVAGAGADRTTQRGAPRPGRRRQRGRVAGQGVPPRPPRGSGPRRRRRLRRARSPSSPARAERVGDRRQRRGGRRPPRDP